MDDDTRWLLASRLHDFGFRGCTSVEQSTIGGAAHLINFDGSDTMSACYYVQFALNNGKPVGSSIPATEHSVMTSWKTEKEAILNVIEHYGTGLYATVLDSYDYSRALEKVLISFLIINSWRLYLQSKNRSWPKEASGSSDLTLEIQ